VKLIEELVNAAESAGVELREDALGEGDHKAASGLVTLKGVRVLFLDKKLGPEEKISVLAAALRKLDLENVYLSPAARKAIDNS